MSDTTATGLHAGRGLAPGSLLAGRFRIEAMLGLGGMGEVYRAFDTTLGIQVALKLLRPEMAARSDAFERFRQELLTARQVSSPRVVRIHDLFRHEGQWLIGMDWIDGEALDRRLDRDGALPVDDAARIARQIAEGLAAAHARGVIHRDLKPANVLLDRNGDALIADFGVARSLAGSGLTQTGAIVGTPDYLSPEQARGEGADARSDLYALGLILHEMLSAQMPFAGGTASEVLAQRMLRTPPPVSRLRADAPAWLVRLTDRLLRPQPAHRLPDAEAVIAAIDHRHVPRDWRPRRRAWIGVGVAATLAAAAAGAWWLRPAPVAVSAQATTPAAAPLQRLLIAPLQAAGDDTERRYQRALAAALRQALAARGVAMVDDERSQQALRQLDPSGAAPPAAQQAARLARAERTLGFALAREGAQWRLRARLQAGAGAAREFAAQGATPTQALDALLDAAPLRDALAVAPASAATSATTSPAPSHRTSAASAPEPPAALESYGAGLIARDDGDLAAAVAALERATAAAPGFAAGWLALGEARNAAGDADGAYAAFESGERAASATAAENAVADGAAKDAAANDATADGAAFRRRFAAERAILDGDAAAAAAYWRERAQATGDDTYAQLALARALGAGGDAPAAIAQLRALAARDPDDPRAWFELGKFSILHGQAQPAVDDYLVRALVQYKRGGNRYGEAETQNALGIGYARLGQNDHALAQYRSAVELRRAVGNRRGLATSLRNLGNVLALTGRFDEAARSLGDARGLYAALDDRHGLAAVENELGLLAEERGDYPAALAAFRRALAAWQQAGDAAGTAQALNDIGFAHYQLGAYDDAQAYLVQSREAYAKLGDETGRVRTAQNLGLLAAARGQWPQARELLQSSLDAALAAQMMEEAAVARRNLGELELMQGRIGPALAQLDAAQALFAQREDARGQADVGLLRAQALAAAHAAAQARATLDALAPQLAQASSEQRGIAGLLRAQLDRAGGDRNGERAALAQARHEAGRSGVRLLRLQVALQAAEADGRFEPALQRDIDALGHAGLRLQAAGARMRLALAAGDADAALRAYRDAQPLLRRGDRLDAAALHALAAQAQRARSLDPAASDARALAERQRLREQLPPALRAGYDPARAQAANAAEAGARREPAR
ncbi:serine/threonine-protein kinase Pkn2 [Lysobacter enzymogenes]|uniref:non-specific serine/threonine protein kinase n=1 Tax=Lysobacter enzymogenes TaxID=69 RepID=A0A0S2DK24_LYSEN|nr:serine/threonine-protein kinase [Lysobacter enzymogenes]ALN58892.1 serine/threonine-protein kinase Pkn2 [Lysobacter enzymogenes]